LVKRIADEHGFSIWVESKEGRGAVFRLRLGPELLPSDDTVPAS
jgi:signal transduction histidine kinase